jgi:heme-degrading monooxygenase HmoA
LRPTRTPSTTTDGEPGLRRDLNGWTGLVETFRVTATVIGVSVTFQYDEDFDHARVLSIAENARKTFEGMPGLRSKAFTVDDARRRAMNFYVWDSEDAARSFFSDELRARVTGLYGVEPTIDFVEIAQLVDNSG